MAPLAIEPVPPDPPAMKPPMVEPTVDGRMASSWPVFRAAFSIMTNDAPASAVISPSPTLTILLARLVSMTRPPYRGIACP